MQSKISLSASDVTSNSRVRVPAFFAVAIIFLSTADALRRVQIGPLTASSVAGLLAGYLVAVGVLLRVADTGTKRSSGREDFLRPKQPVPNALFIWLFWSAITTILYGQINAQIIHPLNMFFVFVVGAWLVSQRCSAGTPAKLSSIMTCCSIILAIVFGVQIIQYGFEPAGIISRRAFGLCAMTAVGFLAAYWYTSNIWRKALVVVLVVEIAFSGSRTALFTSVLLLALSAMSREKARWRALIWRFSAGVAVLVYLVTYWPPLRDRFEEGDGGSFGGVEINTSGREDFWGPLIDYAKANLLTGGGVGQSERLMLTYTTTINQPHNDYLRILVESGLIGLGLFIIGIVMLIQRHLHLAHRLDPENRELHIAAVLVMVGFLVAAYTDNPIVYPFVIVPMAAIIGCSLSQMPGKS